MSSIKTKYCSKCEQEKSVTEFHKDKRTKDGLLYKCKACQKTSSNKKYRERKVDTKGVISKKCLRCGIEKPLSEFRKKKDAKYGVSSRCKICAKEIHAEYCETIKDNKVIREYKACTKCKQDKSIDQFAKSKSHRDGHLTVCKACHHDVYYEKYCEEPDFREKQRAQSEAYKKSERGQEINKAYRKRPEVIAKQKEYVSTDKGKQVRSEAMKRYNAKPESKKKSKLYREEYESRPGMKDKLKKQKQEYGQSEKGKQRLKAYNSRPEVIERKRKDNAKRRAQNPWRYAISKRIWHSLRSKKGGISWTKYVDFTLEELEAHLESLFRPGMTWDNYGQKGWVIDHVRPVNTFNITSPDCDDFKECWALSNLQPLWEKDNLRKGSKVLPKSHSLMPRI